MLVIQQSDGIVRVCQCLKAAFQLGAGINGELEAADQVCVGAKAIDQHTPIIFFIEMTNFLDGQEQFLMAVEDRGIAPGVEIVKLKLGAWPVIERILRQGIGSEGPAAPPNEATLEAEKGEYRNDGTGRNPPQPRPF